MTLLAVVPRDGQILLAADGKAVYLEPGVQQGFAQNDAVRIEKFWRVGELQLMVGCVGRVPSKQVKQSLTTPPADSESWDSYEVEIAEIVADANLAARQAAQRSKAKFDPKHTTNVIVAGYLGDTPGVFAVDGETGLVEHPESVNQGPWFFGLYAGTVRVAFAAAQRFGDEFSEHDPETLRLFLESIADHLPEVLSPIDVWRLTPSTCEKVA